MKDFLNKTWVKVTAWIMLLLALVVLIIDGATDSDINNVVKIVIGILSGIGTLIVFIEGKIKNNSKEITDK